MNQSLVQEFLKANPNVDAVVESGGSLSALIALMRGSVDVAAMNRELKASEDEEGLKSYLLARNGVGIVISPNVKLMNLRPRQVSALLSGEVVNWSMVGGPNANVKVISRKRGSTAREFVEDVVLEGGDIASHAVELDNPKKLVEMVANSEYAVGFISLKDVSKLGHVPCLNIDGVEASRETLLSGRYPFTQSLHLVTKGDSQSTANLYVKFACSEAGQNVVDAAGFVGTY